MLNHTADANLRPTPDKELIAIADYVANKPIKSALAYSTASYCLMDAISCLFLALEYAECTKLLGPIIPGTVVPKGARVPGTSFELDPIQAAFNIGTLIRWLDFNDTWLAAEWGHPSDNLGAILAVADYVSRNKNNALTMRDVLTAMIKAYEIQGVLALENSFNRIGLDHVVLVKIASTAVATQLLGGTQEQIVNALSHAWIDGQSLRTYRHAPNTGSRKSWAAGDATSRGVRLAWMVQLGELGYPSALSAKTWGFNDVILRGQSLRLPRDYDSYVMENILFKISYPAEFHAQTAVECAIRLHASIVNRIADIDKIVVETQESAVRIISKTGPLYNPADRDHCLQYMIAAGLLFGNLTAEYYENEFAKDERIDLLRSKMQISENLEFSKDYLAADKRSIPNAIQIFFNDGSKTDRVQIDYPLGHKNRRDEGIPLLVKKFESSAKTAFPQAKTDRLIALLLDQDRLEKMPATDFMELLRK